MRIKRCEMGVDSRLRYYEAFVSVRDIVRAVAAACEMRCKHADTPTKDRLDFRVEQLRWQCALAALESKRKDYDSNQVAVYAPWAMELRAISQLAAESRIIDVDRASIAELRLIATESIQFFEHLHP